MIVIILCGGSGTRLQDYSLPKPLNLINGKPAIFYSLSALPNIVDTIHFIVAPHLIKFNFDTIVINEFKNKKCIFHNLPYFTRGAIESALLGTLDIIANDNESIVFLDNDVVYDFPDKFFTDKNTAFLGYSKDKSNLDSFSFLKLNNDNYVIEYKEKKRISDMFCCGVYGFKNIYQFRKLAYDILINSKSLNNCDNNNNSNNINVSNELYMSLLFNKLLYNQELIKGIEFSNNVIHIGSIKELKTSIKYIKSKPMRICFDLDNTLVSYPLIPYDYSSVKPIKNMIDLAQKLKKEGNTIIIHTARRMATHNNNVGAVIKDIGIQTFKTLDMFNIPYDELIFGKPLADIYIDDRGANPYRKGSIQSMGYIGYEETNEPINILPNNKYNSIRLDNSKIIKTGLTKYLLGESYFYCNIPKNSIIYKYFPIYYDTINTIEDKTTMEIILEYIPNIPLYTLYKSNLLSTFHIDKIFEFLDILHNIKNDNINDNINDNNNELPSIIDIKSNYIDKLKNRFLIKEDYPFDDADEIQLNCINCLESYFENNTIKIENNIVSYIHGDCWFSNILLDYETNLKFIDMKGIVNNKLTTGGDIMYDYGKLYQSILGYDSILYGDNINISYYNKIKEYFESRIINKNINLTHLKLITFSLVIGTLHSISNIEVKNRIWLFIKTTFCNINSTL